MAGQAPKTGRQRPGESLTWFFDFGAECYRLREPGRAYAVNDVVRPATPTGYEYKCTTAGQTAGTAERPHEPAWPRAVGGTVTDGSVVWTAQLVSNSGLRRTISSKTVTVDAGLTEVSSAIVNEASKQGVSVRLSSTQDGKTLDCLVRATFSDSEIAELALRLEIGSQSALAE